MSLIPPWKFDKPACAGTDTYDFYVEDDGTPITAQSLRKTKTLCNSCIHQSDCAEWGIFKERFGVWGGLSSDERARIRRRRRVPAPMELI